MSPDVIGKIKPTGSSHGIGRIWEENQNMPRLGGWRLNLYFIQRAVSSLVASALISLVSILTIAVSLFIFSLFLLMFQSLDHIVDKSREGLTLSIFIDDDMDAKAVASLRTELQNLDGVEKVDFRSKDEALEKFRGALGERADLLSVLEGNPLPASLEVSLRDAARAQSLFKSLAEEFSRRPNVEQIIYNNSLAAQISSVMAVLRWLGLFGILLMILMTSFVICNTIRLALYARGDELEVMRLVGATRNFIRTPCLIEGLIQGLMGAALGLGLLFLMITVLQQNLGVSPALGQLFQDISYLSTPRVCMVLGLGILVGVLGSFIAVRPFLHESNT